MFSAKLTIWKELATTFQYLGTAPSQHRDGFFITQSLSVSRRCLVVHLARSIDPRCTQPDWDAAVEQFSLLFFLRLLSDKEEQISARTCTTSWNRSAESKVYCRAGAARHCRSRLFVRESSKSVCCLLKQRLNRRPAGRHCQETL